MNTQELAFLRECIELRKKAFYYFKDKYALNLLSYYLREGQPIHAIKKSAWGFLLEKPLLREILATLPGKVLTADRLNQYWPEHSLAFTLSLGQWGMNEKHRHTTWKQTSRPGLNLVLQLNFGQHHNRLYHQLIQPFPDDHPFIWHSHPVNREQNFTMAWARLDVSLETGEVLVEEIQNDWLREADATYHSVSRLFRVSKERMKKYWFFQCTGSSYGRFRQYYENVLQPYQEVWDEATLAAVIWFCREELGISRIYYHTFETGNYLKNLDRKDNQPPQSLYTKLPRRFGFRETEQAPELLQQTHYLKKKLAARDDLKWFVLNLA